MAFTTLQTIHCCLAGMAPERMGKAFSVHTFSGFLGGALAPPVMIGVALMLEPRWAFAVAAMAGLAGKFCTGDAWRGAGRCRTRGLLMHPASSNVLWPRRWFHWQS